MSTEIPSLSSDCLVMTKRDDTRRRSDNRRRSRGSLVRSLAKERGPISLFPKLDYAEGGDREQRLVILSKLEVSEFI